MGKGPSCSFLPPSEFTENSLPGLVICMLQMMTAQLPDGEVGAKGCVGGHLALGRWCRCLKRDALSCLPPPRKCGQWPETVSLYLGPPKARTARKRGGVLPKFSAKTFLFYSASIWSPQGHVFSLFTSRKMTLHSTFFSKRKSIIPKERDSVFYHSQWSPNAYEPRKRKLNCLQRPLGVGCHTDNEHESLEEFKKLKVDFMRPIYTCRKSANIWLLLVELYMCMRKTKKDKAR